jgi:hypothetical protein
MGYHPETLAFSFPPYVHGRRITRPDGSVTRRGPWLAEALYALKPWIGFDIWHIDPEKPGTGNRTDDSCGWFDRTPGEYRDAVTYVCKDSTTLHDIRRALLTRAVVKSEFGHVYPRMLLGETMAVCVLVARELELRRWWNGQDGNGGAHASFWLRTFTRKRDVTGDALDLALNPLDNLSSEDDPERLVRLIAGALNRRYRPWWKHPRWHVHHWKINFDLVRNLRRMFERCVTCGRPIGFGKSPCVDHRGMHHSHCVERGGCEVGAVVGDSQGQPVH